MGIFSEGIDEMREEHKREVYELNEQLEKARRRIHDANAIMQRMTILIERCIAVCRSHPIAWREKRLKETGDDLETSLFTELSRGSITKWDKRALVEHAIAVVAELERRDIKTFTFSASTVQAARAEPEHYLVRRRLAHGLPFRL